MTKQEIIREALELPEYNRKQIVIALMASMITDDAWDQAQDLGTTTKRMWCRQGDSE